MPKHHRHHPRSATTSNEVAPVSAPMTESAARIFRFTLLFTLQHPAQPLSSPLHPEHPDFVGKKQLIMAKTSLSQVKQSASDWGRKIIGNGKVHRLWIRCAGLITPIPILDESDWIGVRDSLLKGETSEGLKKTFGGTTYRLFVGFDDLTDTQSRETRLYADMNDSEEFVEKYMQIHDEVFYNFALFAVPAPNAKCRNILNAEHAAKRYGDVDVRRAMEEEENDVYLLPPDFKKNIDGVEIFDSWRKPVGVTAILDNTMNSEKEANTQTTNDLDLAKKAVEEVTNITMVDSNKSSLEDVDAVSKKIDEFFLS
ncbi:hypothetical protein EDC01DRAFT_636281 [Geopyxis carbonaria]|nr:hypothetical protein EDC01DRAFT_636281 [Geopyxis carbonaria]